MTIRFWRRPPLPEACRQALEQWARVRLQMLHEDPMVAIIGAVGRLTNEGMEPGAAIDTVVRLLQQHEDRPSP